MLERSFELVLVRHGRTSWNLDGRYQGHTDIELDDTGRAQAAALAALFASTSFSFAVSSDLARARETAQILLGSRASLLECDARWREMRFGDWEGLTREQIVARTPALQTAAAPAPRTVTPENGESFAALSERVRAALDTVAARTEDGGRALVTTHAGPLHAALGVLLGNEAASALDVKFAQASYTSLAIEGGVSRLLALNRSAS